jgi:hypothetical protein
MDIYVHFSSSSTRGTNESIIWQFAPSYEICLIWQISLLCLWRLESARTSACVTTGLRETLLLPLWMGQPSTVSSLLIETVATSTPIDSKEGEVERDQSTSGWSRKSLLTVASYLTWFKEKNFESYGPKWQLVTLYKTRIPWMSEAKIKEMIFMDSTIREITRNSLN